MNRLISAGITASLVLAGALTGWAQAGPKAPTVVSIENEYVRTTANGGERETGRFSVNVTNGYPAQPDSQNQPLIYGGKAPYTSYTTVRIDGTDFIFGGRTVRRAGAGGKFGTEVTAPVERDGVITCAYKFGDITVQQDLQIVRGQYSRVYDTVGIKYRLFNDGTTAHEVGLRLLVDTMCGKNDGAPFRIANKIITKPIELPLAGEEFPEYFMAFDSVEKPTVVSLGTLRGGSLTTPNSLVVADWGTLADDQWHPTIPADATFIRKGEDENDTAAAIFWNPTTVAAGQTRTILTQYGIGDVSFSKGKLSLGLFVVPSVDYDNSGDTTFNITGMLENSGGFPAKDTVLSLELPEGLELVGGSKRVTSYAELKPADGRQETWTVRPTGIASGPLTIKLNVMTKNGALEPNSVKRIVNVNVPVAVLTLNSSLTKIPLTADGMPANAFAVSLDLTPADNFYGTRLTLTYDPAVIAPMYISRGSAFVGGDVVNGYTILTDWKYTFVKPGIITISGTRAGAAVLRQPTTSIACIRFRTVGTGKCDLQVQDASLLTNINTSLPLSFTGPDLEVVR